MEEFICKYCGKVCKNANSLRNHERLCKKNPNRQISPFVEYNKKRSTGEISIWNKGLTKETDERVAKSSNTLKNRYLSGELKSPNLGRPHTEEEKEFLSKTRKEYLKAHPDKVPYLLNHHSKQSYPEKYFEDLFSKDDILNKLQKEFKVGLYSLDFAIPDIKYYIEIDGEQHYVDKRIVEHDIIRTQALNNLGWTGKRIRWSEYQKMNFEEKIAIINDIKNEIINILNN